MGAYAGKYDDNGNPLNPDTGQAVVGWKDPKSGQISTDPSSGFGEGSIPLWSSGQLKSEIISQAKANAGKATNYGDFRLFSKDEEAPGQYQHIGIDLGNGAWVGYDGVAPASGMASWGGATGLIKRFTGVDVEPWIPKEAYAVMDANPFFGGIMTMGMASSLMSGSSGARKSAETFSSLGINDAQKWLSLGSDIIVDTAAGIAAPFTGGASLALIPAKAAVSGVGGELSNQNVDWLKLAESTGVRTLGAAIGAYLPVGTSTATRMAIGAGTGALSSGVQSGFNKDDMLWGAAAGAAGAGAAGLSSNYIESGALRAALAGSVAGGVDYLHTKDPAAAIQAAGLAVTQALATSYLGPQAASKADQSLGVAASLNDYIDAMTEYYPSGSENMPAPKPITEMAPAAEPVMPAPKPVTEMAPAEDVDAPWAVEMGPGYKFPDLDSAKPTVSEADTHKPDGSVHASAVRQASTEQRPLSDRISQFLNDVAGGEGSVSQGDDEGNTVETGTEVSGSEKLYGSKTGFGGTPDWLDTALHPKVGDVVAESGAKSNVAFVGKGQGASSNWFSQGDRGAFDLTDANKNPIPVKDLATYGLKSGDVVQKLPDGSIVKLSSGAGSITIGGVAIPMQQTALPPGAMRIGERGDTAIIVQEPLDPKIPQWAAIAGIPAVASLAGAGIGYLSAEKQRRSSQDALDAQKEMNDKTLNQNLGLAEQSLAAQMMYQESTVVKPGGAPARIFV